MDWSHSNETLCWSCFRETNKCFGLSGGVKPNVWPQIAQELDNYMKNAILQNNLRMGEIIWKNNISNGVNLSLWQDMIITL